MTDAYDELVASGAIGSLKRDILFEASRDVFYVAHVRRRFAEDAGAAAAMDATACTVRIIRELVEKNLCSLATWGKEAGSFELVDMTLDELSELVEKLKSFNTLAFDYFLIATASGREWVARYDTLVNEL